VAKVRINPGNLGLAQALEVGKHAAQVGAAVRIGVNSGSVPEKRRRLARTPEALGRVMADLALEYAGAFERARIPGLVLSVKSSDVRTSAEAYRRLAAHSLWPLHLGITEAGGALAGAVKSAAGLAPLLLEGLGDTLRVSLTGDPVQEISVANQLLAFTGVRRRGPEIIACPTCGRTRADLPALLDRVEKALARESQPITVAVMGCVVNGPGEARHADVGLAGAPDGTFMLFAQGKPLRKVSASRALPALLAEIRRKR
jgi:(E)-4-hydroxy-3-methylbut-2-enyl-diphosphate synthase